MIAAIQAANKIPTLIDVHTHTLWTMYLIGQAMHIMILAYASANGATTPAEKILGYLKMKWPVVIARVFITTLVFIWWTHDPEAASDVARYFGSKFPDGAIHDFLFNVGIPLNVATAGAFGYLADSLLDKGLAYVPFFSGVVPQYSVETKEVTEVKHTITQTIKPSDAAPASETKQNG